MKFYKGKCGIILWNYWWREFKERMTKLNILKGVRTCLDGWEKWEDFYVISPKVKNIFDFTFFYYYIGFLKGKVRWNFCIFFSHSWFSHPPYLHLLQSFNLLKISESLHSFLLLRFVSWFFTFVLHVWWEDCWCELFKSWEMFYYHEFMFIWYEISRIWGYLLVNVKEFWEKFP